MAPHKILNRCPFLGTLPGWFLFSLIILVPGPALSQVPPGYYDSVDATDALTLRQTLHEVIDDHTRFPYSSSSTDTWDILKEAGEDPANASNILDLYRNTSLTKQPGGNSFYNREHSWPKSYGFPNDSSENYPYTDCHALFLCDSGYNSSRGNKPYRYCSQGCTERPTEENQSMGGGTTGVYPGTSNWTSGAHSSGAWETWVGRRGDVARALFYMDVRYEGGVHGATGVAEPDLRLTDNELLISQSDTDNNEDVAYMGMLAVLLEWHTQDPVDDLERQHNDAVFLHQGNRNPFVDHPEWVACVFQEDCGATTTTTTGGAEVWISEFHYDNQGADVGEFVEVTGPAGTNLTGWMLIGYNGASGSLYRTISLSGTLPDQAGGQGAVAFAFDNLQNGPSDGLALVDPSGAVIEFWSYEGPLTAANGPAAGLPATDVGVEETGSSAAGQSLQRGQAGAAWSGPDAQSRGSLNP